ncbi:hypothetical protein [Sphaerisporangium fuscum]|uniref:hypothetical protein n=1 Tax=Sphaerisporangium fuscum TaxID=2835868 RepID=UPI001BDD49E5|nr:hypothetical protein [Sphaerisporangium fuscum]
MNAPAKIGAYVLGLAVVFGGAFGAGGAVGGDMPPAAAGHGAHAESGHGGSAETAPVPGGLQVSQDGYTLTPLTRAIKPGEATDFRFAVTGPDGRPVTAYQVEHDKKLHFIVVPRDLGGFQHLHPSMAADGTWSVPLTLPTPGTYRAFADFTPENGDGITLGVDLYAPGGYEPKPLPAPSRTAEVDGYSVTLDGDLVPGRSSELTLTVSKDGKPVTDLQPYLGAYGHLVALRDGDLAYLHVHPDGEPGDGRTTAGPGITFYAEVPSVGDYRLFLDFQHGGTVRTAAFTVRAAATPASGPAEPSGHGEHGH